MARVGIVICAWNCVSQVRIAVESAIQTCSGSDYKLLIHDDCSEIEDVRALFENFERFQNVEYLRQDLRRGVTNAWNKGIDWALQSSCDCVALCNQDVQFVPGWIIRFVKDVNECKAVSPLTNSPGFHRRGRGSLQQQDIRNYVSSFVGKDIEPNAENFCFIMNEISGNMPVIVSSVKGFFLGFSTEWLFENRICEGEYYSNDRAGANGGVGGSESEIFTRTGFKPSIATDIYVHHFRKKGEIGEARKLFLSCKRGKHENC